jgi:hypothetical protein
MESESIVEVAKDPAGYQPKSEGKPVRSACIEDEEPNHDSDGSDDRNGAKEPSQTLAEPEQGT